MLKPLTFLLLLQLCGEIIVRYFGLPIPGPVVGLILVFAGLLYYGRVPPALRETANRLFENLSLLYIPAGVGVMVHFASLSKEFWPIFIAMFVSTLLAMAATALTLNFFVSLKDGEGEPATDAMPPPGK